MGQAMPRGIGAVHVRSSAFALRDTGYLRRLVRPVSDRAAGGTPVTAGTVDYPDVAVGTDRTANALERIATALERQAVVEEQKFLAQMPSEHAAFNAANPPRTAPAAPEIHPWDN